MENFNWPIALLIFASYCSFDWLYTVYTLSIVKRRKWLAANIVIGLYLLSAIGIINYVDDWRYILPMCIGGWLGTFFSVWHEERKAKRE